MEEKKIGVSLSKTIELGEEIARRIERYINVAESENSMGKINKIVNAINKFYNDISQFRLSGENREKVIDTLKSIRPYLPELNAINSKMANSSLKTNASPSK